MLADKIKLKGKRSAKITEMVESAIALKEAVMACDLPKVKTFLEGEMANILQKLASDTRLPTQQEKAVAAKEYMRVAWLDKTYEDGQTLLHLAVQISDTSKALGMVQYLLGIGITPGIQDRNGNTPLHLLADKYERNNEVVKAAQQASNVILKNYLQTLLENPLMPIMVPLAAHGCDPGIRNNINETVLELLPKAEQDTLKEAYQAYKMGQGDAYAKSHK